MPTEGEGQLLLADIIAKFQEAQAQEFATRADQIRTVGRLRKFQSDRRQEELEARARAEQEAAAQPQPSLEEVPINTTSPQPSPVSFVDLANQIGNQANVQTRQAMGTAPSPERGAQQVGQQFQAPPFITTTQRGFQGQIFRDPSVPGVGQVVPVPFQRTVTEPNVLSQFQALQLQQQQQEATQRQVFQNFTTALNNGASPNQAANIARASLTGDYDALMNAYEGVPNLEVAQKQATIENTRSLIDARKAEAADGLVGVGLPGFPSLSGGTGGPTSDLARRLVKGLSPEQIRLTLKDALGPDGLTSEGKAIRVPLQGEYAKRNQIFSWDWERTLDAPLSGKVTGGSIRATSFTEVLAARAVQAASELGIPNPNTSRVPTPEEVQRADKILEEANLYQLEGDQNPNLEFEQGIDDYLRKAILPAWGQGQPTKGPTFEVDPSVPSPEPTKTPTMFDVFFGDPLRTGAAVFRGGLQGIGQATREELVRARRAAVSGVEDVGRRLVLGERLAPFAGRRELAQRLGQTTFTPLTEVQPSRFDDIFTSAAEANDIPASLVKAVASAESNFDPKARSSVGAVGVMQLMPETAQGLGVSDREDPAQNIAGGARYLAQLHEQFGNWVLALAAYNAGPANVSRHGGVPPFEETQKYIPTVMERYIRFAKPNENDPILRDFRAFQRQMELAEAARPRRSS